MDEEPHMKGRRVWEEVSSQVAELRGFVRAAVASSGKLLRSRLVALALFAALGILAGLGVWQLKSPVYEAEMTVSYQLYEKKIYADMIAKLNELIRQKNYASLAALLNWDEANAQNVIHLKTYNIKREPLQKDLSTGRIPFYISAGLSEPALFPELQDALLGYLNGTPYITERLAFMEQQHAERYRFLTHRIQLNDSISHFILSSSPEARRDGNISNLIDLQRETLELHEQLAETRGSIQFNTNVEVLDGFVASNGSPGRALPVYLLYGGLIGVGVRLFWLLLTGT